MQGTGLLALVAAFGLLLVVGLLTVGPLYLNTLERLAFSRTLSQMGNNLPPQVWTSFASFVPEEYRDARADVIDAAEGALGDAVVGQGIYVGTYLYDTITVDPAGLEAVTVFQYRSDYESHVRLVDGEFPKPTSSGPLEVAIGESAAQALHLSVGQTFHMQSRLPAPAPSFDAVLVGVVAPHDLDETYWAGQGPPFFETLSASSDPRGRWLLRLFITEETLLGRLGTEAPGALGVVNDIIYLDETVLLSMGAKATADSLLDFEGRMASSLPSADFTGALGFTVEDFREEASLTRIPLVIVLALVETIALYSLIMIVLALGERQTDSVVLLRSRGAGLIGTVTAILLWALIVTGVTFLIAPFIAASIVFLVGYTPGWQAVLDSETLSLAPLLPTVPWAFGGALIAVALLVLPSTQIARTPLALLRTSRSRMGGAFWFQRLFFDVGLLVLAGAVLWQLRQRGDLVAQTVSEEVPEASIDRTALLVPVFAVLVVVLLFYRLLPIIVRIGSAVTQRFNLLAPALAMDRMARAPGPALIVGGLFLLVAALGAFIATFGGTLDQSADDYAAYTAGGDARVLRIAGYKSSSFSDVRESYLEIEGVENASSAYRTNAGTGLLQIGTLVPLLAVDPTTISGVLAATETSTDVRLDSQLANLALTDGTTVSRRIAPENTQSIGIWAKPEFGKANRFLWLHLIDATGAPHTYSMGPLDFTEWTFVEVPLARTTQPAPPGPYLIDSILVYETAQGATGSPGSLLLDDLQARNLAGELQTLDSFDRPSDWLPVLVTGERRDIVQAATGGSAEREQVLRFEWGRETQDGVRGIYISPGGRSVPVLASPALLTSTGLAVGQERALHISERLVPIRVVGVVDQFPTVELGSAGFLVADGPSLLSHLNAVNVGRDVWPNEVLLKLSDDPALREAALTAIQDTSTLSGEIVDREELQNLGRRSALASAGWRGLALFAVVASVASLILGVTVHAVSVAQNRTSDMAVLRTLGLGRGRVLFSLLVEYAVIVGFAAPIGIALGMWLSRVLVPLFHGLGVSPTAPTINLTLDWMVAGGVVATVVAGALIVALFLWRVYSNLHIATVIRAAQD